MKHLDEAIGQILKDLRESPTPGIGEDPGDLPKLTPEDVATAARELGIPWRRGTVSAIELGTRKLWVTEFLLLGEILRRAWARRGVDARFALPDLLPDGLVVAGGVSVDSRGLKAAVSGLPLPPEAIGRNVDPELLSALWQRRAARLEPRHTLLYGELPAGLDLATLGREAKADAELKLARRLGVDPEAVVIAAHQLWAVGFTEKRDAEVGDTGGMDRESLRTKRGRMTVRLAEELADHVRAIQLQLTDRMTQRTPHEPDGNTMLRDP